MYVLDKPCVLDWSQLYNFYMFALWEIFSYVFGNLSMPQNGVIALIVLDIWLIICQIK